MTAERFLTLADVAEILNISASQTYALVRSGDLQGIQIGGRNQWRVERSKHNLGRAKIWDPTEIEPKLPDRAAPLGEPLQSWSPRVSPPLCVHPTQRQHCGLGQDLAVVHDARRFAVVGR